jgi:NCS2 family nucleobase:cation symporter-2/xanthine permease XanP
VFNPLVSGVVVLLIGLSIIPEAMNGIASPPSPGAPSWAGAAIAVAVMAVVIATQAFGGRRLRLAGILIGVAAGYALCALCGYLHAPGPSPWLAIPHPFKFGFAFDWNLAVPFAFIYVVSLLEALGDMTATAQLSGLDTRGPEHAARLRGGVLTDGLTSMAAAVMGSFPSTTYAQNNGVIQITGVASRRIGRWMAVELALLGILPAVGKWVTAMPPAVLGGMALLLFGMVSVSGLRLIQSRGLTHRDALVVAVSLGVGLGAPSQAHWLATLPGALRSLLESGISAGGVAALILNLCLPEIRAEESGSGVPPLED